MVLIVRLLPKLGHNKQKCENPGLGNMKLIMSWKRDKCKENLLFCNFLRIRISFTSWFVGIQILPRKTLGKFNFDFCLSGILFVVFIWLTWVSSTLLEASVSCYLTAILWVKDLLYTLLFLITFKIRISEHLWGKWLVLLLYWFAK